MNVNLAKFQKKSLIVEQFQGNCLNDKDGKNDQYYMKSVFLSYSTVLCTACCLPFPGLFFTFFQGSKCLPFPRNVFFSPGFCLCFPSDRYMLPIPRDIIYFSPRMLFTFPQGYCLPFLRMLFVFPQGYCLPFPTDMFTFPQGCCLPFLRDVVYFSPGMSFTFPQGESQAGSPGLLAFQSAKSRSDFLSPGF